MGFRSTIKTRLVEMRCSFRFMKRAGRYMPGKPFSSAVLLDERVAATSEEMSSRWAPQSTAATSTGLRLDLKDTDSTPGSVTGSGRRTPSRAHKAYSSENERSLIE